MTSASMLRSVFDTNTLVSALLFSASTPRRAVDYAFEHGKVLISLSHCGDCRCAGKGRCP
jgi:hypothetical protein